MLFDTTTAPQLKPWLVRTLEPICDAEPGALAEYILALLKHNVAESEMRKELTAQLDEFLEKECSSFIDTLFAVLRTKTYLPYATDSVPKQPRAMDTGIPLPLDALLSLGSERGQKRSMDYDDRDGRPTKGPRLSVNGGQGQFQRYPDGMGDGQWGSHGGMNPGGMSMNGNMGYLNGRRPIGYQPPDQKRGLCRDYHNQGFCARGELCKYSHGEEAVIPGQLFPMNGQQISNPQMPYMGMYPNGGMPFGMNGGAYDPKESQLDMRPMPQGQGGVNMGIGMGGGVGGVGVGGVGVGGRPRVPVLPRMQQEGVAKMAHNRNASGELPVIQDLTPKLPKDEVQLPPRSQNGTGDPAGYSNGGPSMAMEVDSNMPMKLHGGFRGGMRGGGGGGGRGVPRDSGGAQPMRPMKGRNDKTLVVEKIPEDKLSLDAVNGWFKRFGTVTNVAIDPRTAKALVTFEEHEEAHRAWKSEDAVFNNRFVKLFWHRPMEGHGQGGARALAASANIVANINGLETTSTLSTQPTTTAPSPAPKLTPRKSITPSETASALAVKQQLLERQIAEQKLLMNQLESASLEEKKQIMTRLRKLGEEMKPVASPTPTSTVLPSTALTNHRRGSLNLRSDEHQRKERERLDKELESHSNTNDVEGVGEENTEDLKAKLARLKAEAASLGLPEVGSETTAYRGSHRPYRGRGRAARSYYRGATLRGGPPRASMKLDNRPKKLLVKGASEDSVQAVRDWYETMGQVDSVEPSDNGDIIVSFRTRSAAEQGLAKGQNISQVGPVQLSWYSGQPSSITKKTIISSSAASLDAKEENGVSHEPVPSSDGDDRHHSPQPQEEEVVANGWGGTGDEDGMGML